MKPTRMLKSKAAAQTDATLLCSSGMFGANPVRANAQPPNNSSIIEQVRSKLSKLTPTTLRQLLPSSITQYLTPAMLLTLLQKVRATDTLTDYFQFNSSYYLANLTNRLARPNTEPDAYGIKLVDIYMMLYNNITEICLAEIPQLLPRTFNVSVLSEHAVNHSEVTVDVIRASISPTQPLFEQCLKNVTSTVLTEYTRLASSPVSYAVPLVGIITFCIAAPVVVALIVIIMYLDRMQQQHNDLESGVIEEVELDEIKLPFPKMFFMWDEQDQIEALQEFMEAGGVVEPKVDLAMATPGTLRKYIELGGKVESLSLYQRLLRTHNSELGELINQPEVSQFICPVDKMVMTDPWVTIALNSKDEAGTTCEKLTLLRDIEANTQRGWFPDPVKGVKCKLMITPNNNLKQQIYELVEKREKEFQAKLVVEDVVDAAMVCKP